MPKAGAEHSLRERNSRPLRDRIPGQIGGDARDWCWRLGYAV